MSIKNIYLFKISIQDTHSNRTMPPQSFKSLFQDIFNNHCRNFALKLTYEDTEPIMLDIIEDNNTYLFARLNRKRPNNTMQKRNYNTYETTDVLHPNEIDNTGVEWFTYCILGYKHGILSLVHSNGAPNENSLARIFALYNNRFSLETEPIPNQNLIQELINGQSPEINKIQIDIPQPNIQVLQSIFGFNDDEIIQTLTQNTSSIVFDVKPSLRSALSKDKNIIVRLIDVLKQKKGAFRSVILSGKTSSGERQRRYDLYEEYFKYPININEYKQENNRKSERDKDDILTDYKHEMMKVYDNYKEIILAISDR